MTEHDDHAAHRLMPGSEPAPAADAMISPAGLRIRELERERDEALALSESCSSLKEMAAACVEGAARIVELEAENARLRRALDAAETKLTSLRRSITAIPGGDPLLPQVAVEPRDVGDDRDYGF